MKIIVASDHAGLDLKNRVAAHLQSQDHEVKDAGTHSRESVDYPQFAAVVARGVVEGRFERGILVCGSGIGMCMAANRIPGVRAVNAAEPYAAKMSRRHNDSNVLCLGGRFIGQDLALEIVDTWIRESFEGGRHQKRVQMIDEVFQD